MPTNLDVTCGTVTNMWGVELVLLCLPQAFRLIQSVKRYVDSSMYMHLVNVSVCGWMDSFFLGLTGNRQENMLR